MTYRGGQGTFLYENAQFEDTGLVFRMTAKNEKGANGSPITIHARNVAVLNPTFFGPNGIKTTAWVGAEDSSVRSDPLLMLVKHDAFGTGVDAVFLPEVQSETQPGVPPWLSFFDAEGGSVANAVLLEGRGITNMPKRTGCGHLVSSRSRLIGFCLLR